MKSSQSSARSLAGPFNSLSLNYYNMSSATGRIIVSTAASSASLVTMTLVYQGLTTPPKTFTFFSGASMRNHQ
jgi:hypothetical protein